MTKPDWRTSTGIALVASLFALPGWTPAAAQSQVRLPSREQIELPEVDAAMPSQVRVIDETRPSGSCPLDSSQLTARMDTVEFVDPDGRPLPPELAQIVQDIRPTRSEAPINQLCRLRDEAATRLLDAGYLAAVTIPQQEINRDTRTARLTVIPARIVAVEGAEEGGSQSKRIAARAERIKALYPVRTSDLERELLLASDNPGLDLRMTLVPAGTRPGEVIGRLQVTRRTYQLLANVQNYGSKAIGREIGSLRAEFYGLTGLSDVTFVGASSTADFEEQWTVQGGHYFTLDSGATFGGSVAYAESRPDLETLDLRSKSLLAAIEGYVPITRTLASRGTLGAGLEIVDQESNLHGGGVVLPLTRDKLRVGFVKLRGTKRASTPDGSTSLVFDGDLQLRKGLDIFGASERGVADGLYFPSSLEGDPQALVLRGGYSVTARSGQFSLLTRLDGQYSSKPLLGFEEYAVGNYTLGRGYDPSVTSGDSALGVRVQPGLIFGNTRAALEPYAFADAVRIWNKDSLTTERERTLVSAGLGARFYLAEKFVIDAGWAHPFNKPLNVTGARRAPDRFLLSLTAAFGASAR